MANMPAMIGIFLAIAGALATLGILVYQNKSRIHRLRDAVIGQNGSEYGGLRSEVKQLIMRFDEFETKLDEESRERRQDHEEVRAELRNTNYLIASSIETISEAVEEEEDLPIGQEDVEPNWVGTPMDPRVRESDDDFMRGGGRAKED